MRMIAPRDMSHFSSCSLMVKKHSKIGPRRIPFTVPGKSYPLHHGRPLSLSPLLHQRHLAEKWGTTYIEPGHSKRRVRPGETMISTIDHFILLDLLGSENPLIRSVFPQTAWLFDGLIEAESRLGHAGYFNEPGGKEWIEGGSFFEARTAFHGFGGYIEDDHVPFLRRGVPILHLIATPFPKVWHTIQVSFYCAFRSCYPILTICIRMMLQRSIYPL